MIDHVKILSKNRSQKKNGSRLSAHLAGVIPVPTNSPEKELSSEFLEMQAINAKSEKIIKQLRLQLVESDSMNSRIFSMIAHDLRSPFQIILGSLELIKMRLDGDESGDFINYINMASESAIRALKLLEDLLYWSISQKSEKNINPVKLDLFELVNNEIDFQAYSVKQKDISLNHSIIRGLKASGDVQMVRAILRNLIDNAIKFTNPGGEIIVNAFENELYVVISVSDTGIGMSPNQLNELFRTDSLQTTKGTKNENGCGFGLILCKELIEMHGGNLKVESNLDKGSKFTFNLPHYI